MGQLHEVLALESDLANTAKKVLAEGIKTFEKHPNTFIGQNRKLKMLVESPENEVMEAAEEQNKKMDDTVNNKLQYVASHVARYYDAVLQKECANQNAKEDLVVDGVTIAEGVPATMLLGLETKLKEVRNLVMVAPTLQLGVEWVKDTQQGEGVYAVKHPDIRHKTQKKIQHQILVQPTDKHPAQIEKWNEDITIGTYETITWSGCLSTVDKSNMLERVDNLLAAIKVARQRANRVEVPKVEIGKAIFDYILGS